MKEFTVIMPCWIINEEIRVLTEAAIESLGDVELIIIDNGSPIGGGYLRDKADVYIRNKENLGFAKAVNQGLVLAHLGNYIVVANNDIRLSPNWKEVVQEVCLNDEVYSLSLRMTVYDEPFKYGHTVALTGKERWCTGSFIVFNKDQQLYLYDERFLNSYEDWDLFKRIRDGGKLTAYTDKACFQHKDSSTQKFIPERAENEKRNKELFKEKWGEYAEVLFEKQFPEQMKKDWRGGFEITPQ